MQALRGAMHVPQDLHGIGAALEATCSCLREACTRYDDRNLEAWESVAIELLQHFRRQASDGVPEAALWFQPPPAQGTPQDRLASWRVAIAASEFSRKLSALLGRAIAHAASTNGVVPPALIAGSVVLKNALAGKGRRAPQWNDLTESDLLDGTALQHLHKTTDPRDVHFQFIAAALSVLRGSIGGPWHLLSGYPPAPLPADDGSDPVLGRDAVAQFSSDTSEESIVDQVDDPRRREDLFPDIGARLSSSDYSTYLEKLGFVTRDYIAPDDLALVTRELLQHLNCSDKEPSTYAFFALVSLLTGCSDFITLKLGFEPHHSIWLNIDGGAWCWSFGAYRQQRSETDRPITSDPIFVPLPAGVAKRLRELRTKHPAAATLGELVSAALGSQVDLRKFRLFLRSCGNAAHPPYASRFARSMPFVFLHTCASDMTAAMLSAHFAVSAPAALYYFGPSYGVLQQRLRDAYSFLGLDAPTDISNPSDRAGCQKVLEPAQLKAGWSRLEEEIGRTKARTHSDQSASPRLDDINQLMVLLCAAFVIQTAHRGTRLERLTFGAMFINRDGALILDKDDAEREQPRLVPKTPIIHMLLCMASDLHRMVNSDDSNRFDHDTCLFVQWTNTYKEMTPVSTGAIAKVIAEFFDGADFNFARSAWVTHLDEAGCDRWLIRGLTGHTRDVTRTNGPYFDIPPLHVVTMQSEAIGHIFGRLFGETLLTHQVTEPQVAFRSSGRKRPATGAPFMVPDPRTILDPISVDVLAGWRATHLVRDALLQGTLDAPVEVLAVMHMLFMDFVPDFDLCLLAIREPGQVLRCHGNAAGVLWHRPHFVHDTWLPLLPTTARLVATALKGRVAAERICEQVSHALRRVDPGYWPDTTEGCKASIPEATRAFLRLEFPPSLLAVSDPCVPAPAISQLSLMRLSSPDQCVDQFPTGAFNAPVRANSKRSPDDQFKALRKIISNFTSQTIRLGELRKRALNCLKQIGTEVDIQTPFGIWIVDWVVSELALAAEGKKGRLDISSINTYLTVLTRVPHELRGASTEDPYEWSDGHWEHWLYSLNAELVGTSSSSTDRTDLDHETNTDKPALHKRVKDAVGRLVRNLISREHWVPSSIRSVVAESDEKLPSGSASSCLVTESDVQRSILISNSWLEDQPLNKLMVEMRAQIQFLIPTRSGDISNLRIDGITPNGWLVIERVGYKNIKTENSVRVFRIPASLQRSLAEFRGRLLQFQPHAEFMLRGDGTPDAGARDATLINIFSAALKYSTGDPRARPHSLRASALQNLAWPGWQPLAALMLDAQASPRDCETWCTSTTEWTRMAYAAGDAGHADLRAAFGNYLSAWQLIFGIRVMALLNTTAPRPGFLRQLGIDPAALRKFRQRSLGAECEWGWLFSRVSKSSVEEIRAHAQGAGQADSTSKSIDHPSPVEAVSVASTQPMPPSDLAPESGYFAPRSKTQTISIRGEELEYMCARILGMPTFEAVERAGLGLARATELDAGLPAKELILSAACRARGMAQDRGRNGNLNTLFSEKGQQILSWIRRLQTDDLTTAFQFAFKLTTRGLSDVRMTEFWRSLFTDLPATCALHIHRGQRHIQDAERSFLLTNSSVAITLIDGEVGEVPAIRLLTRAIDNRVVGSRLNSVFRASLLARASLAGVICNAN